MEQRDRPNLAIVGAGRVGTAIGRLAVRAGYAVAGIADRVEAAARRAADIIGAPHAVCDAPTAAGRGQIVLLTVPDDAIAPLAAELASAKAFAQGCVVAHTSGVLDSEALAPAREACGCAVGSLHPLQTFPDVPAAVEHFAGTWCFCEGDASAIEALESLATALGGRPVRIARASKPLYHAAAVMTCNYLVALVDAGLAAAESGGIDRDVFIHAIEPIVRATVDNLFRLGPENALTGPIARGDVQTVRRHLADFSHADADPRLADLYRAAGQWTLQLARRKGTLSEPSGRDIENTLRDGTPPSDPKRKDDSRG